MSDNYRRNPNFDATKDRVAGILHEHGLLSATAFVNLIYDDIRSNGGSRFTEEAILGSARRHKVPENQELWRDVFTGFEERDCPANRAFLLKETKPPINPANLFKTLHAILRAGDPGQQLTFSQAEISRQQAAKRKQSLISTISESGKHRTYPLWAANHGAFKYVSCESLAAESDEMLEALAQRVPEWREQLAGDRPEREKLPDGVTATQHARERELESDEFLAHPQHPEREYTPREAKADLRELMFYPGTNQGRGTRRVNAINRLLSGRAFGE